MNFSFSTIEYEVRVSKRIVMCRLTRVWKYAVWKECGTRVSVGGIKLGLD